MDFDKETMRSLMIDHIDGKITGELGKYVEMHIEKNPDAKAEYDELKKVLNLLSNEKELEVPIDGKDIFLHKATEEMKKPAKELVKTRTLNLTMIFKIAAAIAFVIVGYVGGNWLNNKSRSEIEALQSELKKTKELILLSMMKQESASERLKGIFASAEISDVDNDIIDALIKAMNSDGNINVRVAAADALSGFSDNEKARQALIASLNQQTFPAVQFRLIDILVSIGDSQAIKPLKEFSEKDDLIKSVKDEAHMGIFKLM